MDTWWSTRLYILALVADLLTDVRRIVISEGDDFVGMVSAQHVRIMLQSLHPQVRKFEEQKVNLPLPVVAKDALSEVLRRWRELLNENEGQSVMEEAVQMTVTRAGLVRWPGDGMLTGAVRVVDPDQTTVLDLLRVLDYPNEYVPIVAEPTASNLIRTGIRTKLRVINKAMLNAQLAKIHIDDMLISLGLRFRF
jgi:hypothetical protein